MVSNLTFPSNGIENDFPTGKERQGYFSAPTTLSLLVPSVALLDKAVGEDGKMLNLVISEIILIIRSIIDINQSFHVRQVEISLRFIKL